MKNAQTIDKKQLLVDLEAAASEAEPDTFLGASGPWKRLLFSAAVVVLIAVTVLAASGQ